MICSLWSAWFACCLTKRKASGTIIQLGISVLYRDIGDPGEQLFRAEFPSPREPRRIMETETPIYELNGIRDCLLYSAGKILCLGRKGCRLNQDWLSWLSDILIIILLANYSWQGICYIVKIIFLLLLLRPSYKSSLLLKKIYIKKNFMLNDIIKKCTEN